MPVDGTRHCCTFHVQTGEFESRRSGIKSWTEMNGQRLTRTMKKRDRLKEREAKGITEDLVKTVARQKQQPETRNFPHSLSDIFETLFTLVLCTADSLCLSSARGLHCSNKRPKSIASSGQKFVLSCA